MRIVFVVDNGGNKWEINCKEKENCSTISNYIFLGSHKLYSKSNQTQQDFLEDLILYIVKGYHLLSSIENSWLKHLIICQCGHVQFPFQEQLVNEVLLVIMTKPRKNIFSKHLFLALHVETLLIFACCMLAMIVHYVVNFITISWDPTQVTIGVFEV
jgi:hypothetical protein